MSISHIEDWKELRSYGEKLGREELAKRVLECVDCMLKDTHYQGVIEFVGRMKAIAVACSFDSYWSEKRDRGYSSEKECLEGIVNGFEHRYYGYCGKNLLELKPTEEAVK